MLSRRERERPLGGRGYVRLFCERRKRKQSIILFDGRGGTSPRGERKGLLVRRGDRHGLFHGRKERKLPFPTETGGRTDGLL